MDVLERIYAYHRLHISDNHDAFINKHKGILGALIRFVEGHTLLIELLAKLPMRSGMSEEEIFEKLVEGLKVSDTNVEVYKDGEDVEDTINAIIYGILSMNSLTSLEKKILQLMALIPSHGIRISDFAKLANIPIDAITNLKDSNLIIMEAESLRVWLNPVIRIAIYGSDDIRPTREVCSPFIDRIVDEMDEMPFLEREHYNFRRILSNYYTEVVLHPVYGIPLANLLEDSSILSSDVLFDEHASRKELRDALLIINDLVIYSGSKDKLSEANHRADIDNIQIPALRKMVCEVQYAAQIRSIKTRGNAKNKETRLPMSEATREYLEGHNVDLEDCKFDSEA